MIDAARASGLANFGGQPQFQGPIGIAEPYWLNFEPRVREPNEAWAHYVDRTAKETLDTFTRLCENIDFEKEGCDSWEYIKKAADEGLNINEILWFVLYLEQDS